MIVSNQTSSSTNTNTVAVLKTATGTVSVDIDDNGDDKSKVVTGSGTSFDDEIQPGDEIIIGSVKRTVARVVSDTELHVTDNYTADIASTSMTYHQLGQTTGNVNQITFKAHSGNTGTIYVGVTTNADKDGSDVSNTEKSVPVGADDMVPLPNLTDLRHLIVRSPIASQGYSIITSN